MKVQENAEKLKAEIAAMPESEIILPNIPVDVYCHEAVALLFTARVDKKALVGRGMDAGLIDQLEVLADICQRAEGKLDAMRNEKEEATLLWQELEPGAREFRDLLTDEFGFAFRDDHGLKLSLDHIKEGNSDADLVQDLISLKELGSENTQPLKKIRFNMEYLDQAEAMYTKLKDVLGKAVGTAEDTTAEKVFRDKAYTRLKKVVDEVRSYGKFVFRNNRDHAAKYASAYHRH